MIPRFTDFDAESFRRDVWQQKPLLIRNPWAEWTNPLEPDELAGLACEAGVESRLVTRSPDHWSLEHGPLPETRFAQIGAQPWTLLVQAVDQHVPAVAALLQPFRFIPNWRMDDVMVSYAVDGGGVGAHFDQYDVFLVQGLGRRRWQVGQRCNDSSPLLPHDDLRLLADFRPTDEWILESGDILYLPPGYAHDGVAVGDDCMTYSIGFRAPARSELISAWTEHLLDSLTDDDRYADPSLPAQDNPGEIAPSALATVHTMVAGAMIDQAQFAVWFGEFTTTPKADQIDWCPDEPVTADDLRRFAADGITVLRNPASRFAFVRREDGGLWLFADGVSQPCADAVVALAEQLCAHDSFSVAGDLLGVFEAVALLVDLANRGCVAFEPAD